MEIQNSEEYEEIAAEFQYQQILLLKDVLRKYGVEAGLAKEICGDFTFDLSMLIDQGEIKVNRKFYEIQICFRKYEAELLANDGQFEFHEYAYGNTNEAFGK